MKFTDELRDLIHRRVDAIRNDDMESWEDADIAIEKLLNCNDNAAAVLKVMEAADAIFDDSSWEARQQLKDALSNLDAGTK